MILKKNPACWQSGFPCLDDVDVVFNEEGTGGGNHFPDWLLARRKRFEPPLVAVVRDMHPGGVWTQRGDMLVRQLGIDGISKSKASRLLMTHDETVEAIRGRPLETARPLLALDAMQAKVSEAGCTVSVACGTDAVRRYVSLEAHPTRSRSATRRSPRRCG